MMMYAPENWYWFVGGDEKWVYSSANAELISVGDAEYKAWLAQGNAPTRIASMDELKAVLSAAGVSKTPAWIYDWQFYMQLAVLKVITQEEAKAANSAVIPSEILALVAKMPDDQKFAAEMLLGGSTVFRRDHPMTKFIGLEYGWSEDKIDDFFRAAAALG